MLTALAKRIFGSRNERLLRKLRAIVEHINTLEPAMQRLSDAEFVHKTEEYRRWARDGVNRERLLSEAFALVREASKRALGMRHFDVQLIGGMVLDSGGIAEMKTGEGKTLVATLAAYFNALQGHGVHIVTVNDYLAQRDADWMGKAYQFLGMETGVILSGMSMEQRQSAYRADIIYGTNNEFGFDYLRDNMVYEQAMQVQGQLDFAIVDEVDSILIDEARTPLIISGSVDERTDLYVRMEVIARALSVQKSEQGRGDYSIDEKTRQAHLTEEGHERVEKMLRKAGLLEGVQGLYDPANLHLLHHINAALRARSLYRKDVDYIVREGKVIIVDEFTGRTMEGRRWSGGLHQAVEARERVPIQEENQTLATITYQNFFRLYQRLSGMTGTADTEAHEFQQIYGLEVAVIPTHKVMIREDQSDRVYLSTEEKFEAIVADIKDCRDRQQPVLVGTASIEVSESLSQRLEKTNIPHQVLNAKFHDQEAQIIAQAGRPGAVTIATNMAGRGTDIVLGGHDGEARDDWQERHQQVVVAGGLRIVGTERHESRRIDNQLRGRSGRQGDPGSSCFYISLEDNLIRIFASEWAQGLLQRFGMQRGEVIESRMVTRAIERAQRKVEAHNFDIRKNLLQYDDAANEQRRVIYGQRNELLTGEDVSGQIQDMYHEVIQATVVAHLPQDSMPQTWDIPALQESLANEFSLHVDLGAWLEESDGLLTVQQIVERAHGFFQSAMTERMAHFPAQMLRGLERRLMLEVLDRYWKEHLAAMDYLRQGIHLRQFAAKNPVQEYKREAFSLFLQMLEKIRHDVVSILSKLPVDMVAATDDAGAGRAGQQARMRYHHPDPASSLQEGSQGSALPGPEEQPGQPFIRPQRKIGRNEPCPCGSRKKFKHCHGQLR